MKLFLFAVLAAALPAVAAPPEPADLAGPLPLARLAYLDRVASDPGAMLGDAAAAQRLDGARGKADPSASAALEGVVGGNSASNVATGGNQITGGAFSNMSGLPVVIQNSGANVLIQNATVINLQMR